jgi:hypothetical protein
MVKSTHAIAACLANLIITLCGCSTANSSPSHPLTAASPNSITKPIPPEEPRGPPQDLSRKLMERSLTDARLVPPNDEGEWSFTATAFVLQAGKTPIAPDLLTALLGPGKSATRVEGKWRLEDAIGAPIAQYIGAMVLTDIRGDVQDGLKEARLETHAVERHDPDGTWLDGTAVNIAGREYKIEPKR